MSFLASEWASESAPVADTYERIILMKLASHASDDGRGTWPSIPSMARAALCDPETVKRRLKALIARKVIAWGDQRLVSHYRADKRPKVYDLLIPYSWYSDAQREKVNKECLEVGREPLTLENRPDLAAAPAKRKRADLGMPNPKRKPKKMDAPGAGALVEPPSTEGEDSSGGSERAVDGGSLSRAAGALVEPQTSQAGTCPEKTSQAGARTRSEARADAPRTARPPDSRQASKDQPRGSRSRPDTLGAELLRNLRLATPVTEQVVRQCHEWVTVLLESWDPGVLAKHFETEASGGSVLKPMGLLTSAIRATLPRAGRAGDKQSMPDWCGGCDETTRLREQPGGGFGRCACHPAARSKAGV